MIEKLKRIDILLIAGAFLLLLPVLKFQRATDFIIFCIFVLSFDLLYGYMGRLSFGHMLFLGTGAYGAALFADRISSNPFLSILFAIAAAAAVGGLLGPIAVRATGAAFALINLAFNQIGHFLALIAFARFTGGEDGMAAIFSKAGFLDFQDKRMAFAFCLSCLLLTCWGMKRLAGSPFGILLRMIKENETRVKFLGYDTFRYKLTAYVLSAAVAGFAGALSVLDYGYVTPSFIDTNRNVEVIFASLIGGAGSVYGSLAGGVVFMAISNYLATYVPRWEMFLGFGLLLLVFRFRAGIWGTLSSLEMFQPRRKEGGR
ncbi:MAG: branched-chain amino acid ABC transporter permease [Deltaproteobacteria bacterium]|nr:branched-chain amino acid ABC transporter permease [Deltaproteobacteria bacterium]